MLATTVLVVAAAVVGVAGGCLRPWLREVPATCGSPALDASSVTHQRGSGHDLWVSGRLCGMQAQHNLCGASEISLYVSC